MLGDGYIRVRQLIKLLYSRGYWNRYFSTSNGGFRIIAIVRYDEKNEDDQAQHTGY